MYWDNISEETLRLKQTINTSFGQTLSWKYYQYASKNIVKDWNVKTKILYGEKDNIIDFDTIEQFSYKYNCDLTIMKNGEHWFHTKEQLSFMRDWVIL